MGRVFRAVVLGMLAIQGVQGQTPEQAAPPRPFRSGVDLVRLNVSVTDRAQRFVTNLGKQDFIVLEDGRPQAVTFFAYSGVPLTVVILLDTSGSMDGALAGGAGGRGGLHPAPVSRGPRGRGRFRHARARRPAVHGRHRRPGARRPLDGRRRADGALRCPLPVAQ